MTHLSEPTGKSHACTHTHKQIETQRGGLHTNVDQLCRGVFVCVNNNLPLNLCVYVAFNGEYSTQGILHNVAACKHVLCSRNTLPF